MNSNSIRDSILKSISAKKEECARMKEKIENLVNFRYTMTSHLRMQLDMFHSGHKRDSDVDIESFLKGNPNSIQVQDTFFSPPIFGKKRIKYYISGSFAVVYIDIFGDYSLYNNYFLDITYGEMNVESRQKVIRSQDGLRFILLVDAEEKERNIYFSMHCSQSSLKKLVSIPLGVLNINKDQRGLPFDPMYTPHIRFPYCACVIISSEENLVARKLAEVSSNLCNSWCRHNEFVMCNGKACARIVFHTHLHTFVNLKSSDWSTHMQIISNIGILFPNTTFLPYLMPLDVQTKLDIQNSLEKGDKYLYYSLLRKLYSPISN